MADQTQAKSQDHAVAADSVETPPAKGTKVLQYIGLRPEYLGPKGSHKEITKDQLKEAGFPNPFTDASVQSVVWSPFNGYKVPKSAFTEAAYNRLLKEDDLEEATAE